MRKLIKIPFFLLLLLAITTSCEKEKDAIEKADKVMVYKSKRKMKLLKNGEVLRTYRIALGDAPIGHKQQEGDEKNTRRKLHFRLAEQ